MHYTEGKHEYAVTTTVTHTQYIRADTETEAIQRAEDQLPYNIQLDVHALEHHEDADTHWDADRVDTDEYRADNLTPKKGEE